MRTNDRSKLGRLVIVTTVPETISSILAGLPSFLSRYYEVYIITSSGPLVDKIRTAEGVPVYELEMARGIQPIADFVSIRRMVELLTKLRPLVIHSYTPKAGLVTMVSSFMVGVPVRIHTFTGLIFPTATGWRRKLLMAADSLICACATHVVPEGEGVRRDLMWNGITRKPLKVIGHGNIAGIDTNYFNPANPDGRTEAVSLANRIELSVASFVFCYVGRLNRDKGLAELIAAFSRLSGTPQLLVVGALDETAPVDRDTLAAMHAHPRVHMLGFVNDVRGALLASDALVLPSYREGFPNVVLQAGAMEKPAVVTDISGSNEIITDGKNGWIVAPRDTDALYAAMEGAMAVSPETLRAMGQYARRRVRARFEQRDHWSRMMDFYRVLTSTGTAA